LVNGKDCVVSHIILRSTCPLDLSRQETYAKKNNSLKKPSLHKAEPSHVEAVWLTFEPDCNFATAVLPNRSGSLRKVFGLTSLLRL
jgi:hypothetical protein